MAGDDDKGLQMPQVQAALGVFERIIVVVLLATLAVVVALATVDLIWLVAKDVMTPPVLLLEVDELLNIFGFVLLILIGIELLETIKAYLIEHVVHVEIVLEVALIAIARKVIVLDTEKYSPMMLMAFAALTLALALGFYLERKGRLQFRRSAGRDVSSEAHRQD